MMDNRDLIFSSAALLDAAGLSAGEIARLAWLPGGADIHARYREVFAQARTLMGAAQAQRAAQAWAPFAFVTPRPQAEDAPRPLHIRIAEASLEQSHYFPEASPSHTDTYAAFTRKLAELRRPEQLLPLLEQCFATTQIQQGMPLYDFARLSAALACCLKAYPPGEPAALFVKGDLSGIQDFIFDVNSRGAAKSLKARSFRVQALAAAAVEFILNSLGLPPAQVIYNGGGNFYLLVPARMQELLSGSADVIRHEMLSESLALYLAWTPVQDREFQDFTPVWDRIDKRLQEVRLHPYAHTQYSSLFGVLKSYSAADKSKEQEDYRKLTDLLNRSKWFSLSGVAGPKPEDAYLRAFGVQVQLQDRKPGPEDPSVCLMGEALRNSAPYASALWMVKDLPKLTAVQEPALAEARRQHRSPDDGLPELDETHTFESLGLLAGARSGTEKLGVLKLDVDHLGRLFRERLAADRRSLAHSAAISRALSWFFGGYINRLLDQPLHEALKDRVPARYLEQIGSGDTFRNNLYVVFSGGDDFFAVGAWDLVIEFARLLRREFDALTSGRVQVSAGVILVHSRFPVSRFADLASEAERLAKDGGRNRIHLLGETLTWDELERAAEVRTLLFDLVTEPDRKRRESRALIMKVLRSMDEYERLREDLALNRSLRLPRFWRLAYYLRSVKETNRDAVSLLIVDRYNELLRAAMHMTHTGGPSPANLAYISVGARWAELLTKLSNSDNPNTDEQRNS